MNPILLAAALLTAVIALIHSILGERRIFRRLSRTEASADWPLNRFQVGILWASWHLVTVFGLTLSACLFALSLPNGPQAISVIFLHSITFGMTAGAILVAIGTRFRHPAWIGLLLIAGLVQVSIA